MRGLRNAIVHIWVLIPPLILSALVHMADPDIDGWGGLATISVIISVLMLGVFAAAFVVVVLATFVKLGWVYGLASSIVISVCLGSILVAFGTGATTAAGLLWSFIGSSGFIFVCIVLAATPTVVLNWSGVAPRGNRYVTE